MIKKIIISVLLLLLSGALTLSGKEKPPAAKLLFGGSQPLEWLIRAAAPEALCALNHSLTAAQESFFPSKAQALPVIGGFNKSGLDMEVLLKIRPAYVLVSGTSKVKPGHKAAMEKAGIRLVRIKLETLDDYPAAFEKVAALAGNAERGRKLSTEYKRLLEELHSKITAIKPAARKKVYYAAGSDGLTSSAGLSGHSLVIYYAGAENAVNNELAEGRRIRVPIEKIIASDPDVIIIRNKSFHAKITGLPGWRSLQAVKSGRYYLIPDMPVNWFDMPHTYVQLAGAWWLASILYPEKFDGGIEPFIKRFSELFFGVKPERKKC
jgi:iron complex transport system substrate-binding protein